MAGLRTAKESTLNRGINVVDAPWSLVPDWDGSTGTDNTSKLQDLINAAQAGDIPRHITIGPGEFFFAPVPGKTTCCFFNTQATERGVGPIHIEILGTIVIDNSTANTVWLSGPEGDGSADRVSGLHVYGGGKITSSVTSGADSIHLTLPYYGIGFNISRLLRGSISGLKFEYVKGIVQEQTGYDSTSNLIQQFDVTGNESYRAQENFMEATTGYACNIEKNWIEGGNGGFDLYKSSGQSFYRLKFDGNSVQGNGNSPNISANSNNAFRCNFGVGFVFTNNYFESNRQSSGTAATQVYMANGNVALNSITFEGNLFAQSLANLNNYGDNYHHVRLAGIGPFFPRGNDFTNGNGYRTTASTGKIYSEMETYTAVNADSGTTTGTAVTNKLVDTGQNFISTCVIGLTVYNTTDTTTALITDVESDTTLLLDSDIMVEGDTYEIRWGSQGNITANGSDTKGYAVASISHLDDDNYTRLDVDKLVANDTGFVSMQTATVPHGSAHEFRSPNRGICIMSVQDDEDLQAIFSLVDNGTAPLPMATTGGSTLVEFDTTPGTPTFGTLGVAHNVANNRLTITNNFGGVKVVNLLFVAAQDWE